MNKWILLYYYATCFRLLFGRSWRHQKDISKLTDLYSLALVHSIPSWLVWAEIKCTVKSGQVQQTWQQAGWAYCLLIYILCSHGFWWRYKLVGSYIIKHVSVWSIFASFMGHFFPIFYEGCHEIPSPKKCSNINLLWLLFKIIY